MNSEAREQVIRSTHISRCAQVGGRSPKCNCLPVARIELIKHTLSGLTLDEDLRKQLLEEIHKLQSGIRE